MNLGIEFSFGLSSASMEMRNIDAELSPKENSIPKFIKESQDV